MPTPLTRPSFACHICTCPFPAYLPIPRVSSLTRVLPYACHPSRVTRVRPSHVPPERVPSVRIPTHPLLYASLFLRVSLYASLPSLCAPHSPRLIPHASPSLYASYLSRAPPTCVLPSTRPESSHPVFYCTYSRSSPLSLVSHPSRDGLPPFRILNWQLTID